MKKLFIFLLFMVGCCFIFYFFNSNNVKQVNNNTTSVNAIKNEDRMMFISYLDYSDLLKGKEAKEQKKNIDNMINNISTSKFNYIILQVRSFADSIYTSKLFPPSTKVINNVGDNLNFDILDYFIEKAHDKKIKLIAWINPYRIRSSKSFDDIDINSSYYSWLNSNKVEISDQGIYFNPANKETTNLIVNGVKEVVSNYQVDGVLFDDYYYPNKTIDLDNYKEYQNNNGKLSIDDYRRSNISNFIKTCYEEIKKIKNNVLFGISPAGNNTNNYNEEYLDVSYLISNKYIDFIMPQIYYGFENDSMPYITTIDYWNSLLKNTNIKLSIALALYKSGTQDKYAGEGVNEWIENNDIIKKQIIIGRTQSNYSGFSIFRYNYFYNNQNDNKQLTNEVINIKNIF